MKLLLQPIHFRDNLTFLKFRKKTAAHNQSPWFPWPSHCPDLLMKTSFSHLPPAPKAAQHTASCLQKYTLSIPISSFSFPQLLQEWTGPRNRHPSSPKAWRKTSLRHKTTATRSSSFHWRLCWKKVQFQWCKIGFTNAHSSPVSHLCMATAPRPLPCFIPCLYSSLSAVRSFVHTLWLYR